MKRKTKALKKKIPRPSGKTRIPVLNPGPSKEIWDEALKRSGIDPKRISEYNIG